MARILVIDDDSSLLSIMDLMLTRAGHEVLLAQSGQEGLLLARAENPDLAIVDVMMPDMTGFDVCRTLRSDPASAHIPLLILTALTTHEHRADAQKSGADGFVTKPITRNDLVANVNQLLASGPTNTQVVAAPPAADAAPPAQLAAPVSRVYVNPALVTVMGLASGVGAATTAVNLAAGLVPQGRVCLLDLGDRGGQIANQLQILNPRAGWDALAGIAPGDSKRKIGETLTLGHPSGLALVAASRATGQPVQHLSHVSLQYTYEVLAEGFKWLVSYLPAMLNPMSVTSLRLASHVVLVAGDDPTALLAGRDALAMIEALGLPGTIHIIINRTRPHGVTLDEITRALNHPISIDIPYEPQQVNAALTGMPLVLTSPQSLFTRTINQLIRQL